MNNKRLPKLVLQDVVTIYRTNFEGRPDTYNRNGDRNFNVLIPPNLVEPLTADGWNIKATNPPEGDEYVVEHYLPVAVSFEPYPPTMFMVTNQKTLLDESTVMLLDSAVITSMDLIISPSSWSVNGKSGIKAYLKKGFFNIEQDELDDKYSTLPMARSNSATFSDDTF